MIKGNRDITEKEYKKYYEPFYNNMDLYLNNYIVPDVVAFYIANSFYRHCLCDAKLDTHIISASTLFNHNFDVNNIIPQIIDILKIKYNLVITKTNPLRLKRYC